MTRFLTALAAFPVILLLSAASWAQESLSTRPLDPAERSALTPSRAMIDTGRDVASTACAECHGLDGAGVNPGMPHLAGQRMVYLHRMLKEYKDGERQNHKMNHAIGFLNEDALLSVSAYYASLAPLRPAPADGGGKGAGQADTGDPFTSIRSDMKKCDKCHGEDGNAEGSGIPNLTGQDPAYFERSMQAYKDGNRNHRLMQKLAGGLDDDTLATMGVYYGVQQPVQTETKGDGDAEAGKSLAADCAACHGADGNAGSADTPTLAGQDARYFVKAMEAYKERKRENEKMAEIAGKLSDKDFENLATFYASQTAVRRNVRTPLTTAQWINRCDRCHGIDGNSTDPRFPMLAGQDKTYLLNALKSYAEGKRGDTAMHAMSSPLSQADIARIADHYAAQEPKAVVYIDLPCEENE